MPWLIKAIAPGDNNQILRHAIDHQRDCDGDGDAGADGKDPSAARPEGASENPNRPWSGKKFRMRLRTWNRENYSPPSRLKSRPAEQGRGSEDDGEGASDA